MGALSAGEEPHRHRTGESLSKEPRPVSFRRGPFLTRAARAFEARITPRRPPQRESRWRQPIRSAPPRRQP